MESKKITSSISVITVLPLLIGLFAGFYCSTWFYVTLAPFVARGMGFEIDEHAIGEELTRSKTIFSDGAVIGYWELWPLMIARLLIFFGIVTVVWQAAEYLKVQINKAQPSQHDSN